MRTLMDRSSTAGGWSSFCVAAVVSNVLNALGKSPAATHTRSKALVTLGDVSTDMNRPSSTMAKAWSRAPGVLARPVGVREE